MDRKEGEIYLWKIYIWEIHINWRNICLWNLYLKSFIVTGGKHHFRYKCFWPIASYAKCKVGKYELIVQKINWRWRRTEKSQQALDASKNTFLLHAMDTIIHIYMTLRSIADPMDKHKCRKNVKIWQMKIEKKYIREE